MHRFLCMCKRGLKQHEILSSLIICLHSSCAQRHLFRRQQTQQASENRQQKRDLERADSKITYHEWKCSRKTNTFLPPSFLNSFVRLQLLAQQRCSFCFSFYSFLLNSVQSLPPPKWISTFLTPVICGVMKQNRTVTWKSAVWDVKSVNCFLSTHISHGSLRRIVASRGTATLAFHSDTITEYRLCSVCRETGKDSDVPWGGHDSYGWRVGVGGGLKVAVPVSEACLIKSLVQYLRWSGRGKGRRGEKSGPGRISNPLSEGFPNWFIKNNDQAFEEY